jgi:hypothetical protein
MGPAYLAFLHELGRGGFFEGQNLLVDHKGSDQNAGCRLHFSQSTSSANPQLSTLDAKTMNEIEHTTLADIIERDTKHSTHSR